MTSDEPAGLICQCAYVLYVVRCLLKYSHRNVTFMFDMSNNDYKTFWFPETTHSFSRSLTASVSQRCDDSQDDRI
jgi:hypothetical protein